MHCIYIYVLSWDREDFLYLFMDEFCCIRVIDVILCVPEHASIMYNICTHIGIMEMKTTDVWYGGSSCSQYTI